MPAISNLRQPDAGVSEWLTVAEGLFWDGRNPGAWPGYPFPDPGMTPSLNPAPGIVLDTGEFWPHTVDPGDAPIDTSEFPSPYVCVAGWKTLFGMVGIYRNDGGVTPARGIFSIWMQSGRLAVASNDQTTYINRFGDRDVIYFPVTEDTGPIYFEIPITFSTVFCRYYNTHSAGDPCLVKFEVGVYARGR